MLLQPKETLGSLPIPSLPLRYPPLDHAGDRCKDTPLMTLSMHRPCVLRAARTVYPPSASTCPC